MAKSYHNDVFDNGLSAIVSATTKLTLCKAIPTTYTEANNLPSDTPAGFKVGEVVLATPDKVLANKAGGGREITTAAKASGGNVLASTLGSDDLHFAIIDTVGSRLLAVTDETSNQPLTLGNPINFPSLKFGFTPPV